MDTYSHLSVHDRLEFFPLKITNTDIFSALIPYSENQTQTQMVNWRTYGYSSWQGPMIRLQDS